ncbi:RNA polymerase sigma factor [Rhizohabitans arisaemae]|uniref:RNA polymerase sigma factor n=1 Tax=Rhizohabitans arisaemae TaxID=2720610 RepID=UPI0024B10D85|nr:RNA polymerase sigma factor [Rhizohabitans arisaemae]
MDDLARSHFEAAYHSTYEQILGYAMRRCASPEDAADIVAETYLITWRRIGEIPSGDQARLWLYGVARRVIANHRRGELRRRTRHAELLAEAERLYAEIPPEADPAVQAVGEAFGRLNPDDRELLSLAVWEGLDPGEISKVLGCSRNAVRIRLYRARKRLARLLKETGPELGVVRTPLMKEEPV